MPNPAHFEKTYDVIRTDDELGIVYGWGAIFTENGEEYFDTQGDAIDPDAMEIAALDFAENSRVAGDLHVEECGTVPFIMPITESTREAFGMDTDFTGLAIGMKPSAEVFDKFKSGEYTGFSIGGTRIEEEVVEKLAKRDTEKRGKLRQGKRRRMKKFSLEEISAVDAPAQVGAKALLMKRRGEPGYDPKNPDPKKRGRKEIEKRAILTTAANGHSHLLVVDPEDGTGAKPAGFTSFEDGHQHPWVLLDGGTYEIGMADGHSHLPGVISTGQESAMNLLNQQRGERPMPESDLEKLQKRLDRAEKVAELTDVQKGFMKKLDDEAAVDAFLAKSADDRQADVDSAIKKAAEADPIQYTTDDGTEIRKSAGALVEKLARDRDADRKEIAKLRATNSDAGLRKRAVTELDALPGDEDHKVGLLKAIEDLPEELRKGALATLHAGNKAMKAAFNSRGYSGADAGGNGPEGAEILKAEDELESLARKHAAEKGIDYYDAYDAVTTQNPALAKRALGGQAANGDQ